MYGPLYCSFRDSPVAFTINFGGVSKEEVASRRLERLALRSSQRKVVSPRPGARGKEQEKPEARRLTQVIRPGKEAVDLSQERRAVSLPRQKVEEEECEGESEEEGGGEESAPSETGTYTVDREEEESLQVSREIGRHCTVVSSSSKTGTLNTALN